MEDTEEEKDEDGICELEGEEMGVKRGEETFGDADGW